MVALALCPAGPALAFDGPAIIDDRGAAVRLSAPARRVVPLYAAFSGMLRALGRGEALVARTRAEDAPNLPSVGTHMRPNPELVLGLAPDLVLQMAGRDGAAEEAAAMLEARGLTVAVFRLESFDDLFRCLERLGVLTGSAERARALAAAYTARLAAVETALEGVARPRVFYEVRYPNLLAAGRGSLVDEIINRAGGDNCVELAGKLVRLSEEELVRLDPEVYIQQRGPMHPRPSPPAQRPHYRGLAAVRAGRVLVVEGDRYARPGPWSVEAVEELARRLHPGRFATE